MIDAHDEADVFGAMLIAFAACAMSGTIIGLLAGWLLWA